MIMLNKRPSSIYLDVFNDFVQDLVNTSINSVGSSRPFYFWIAGGAASCALAAEHGLPSWDIGDIDLYFRQEKQLLYAEMALQSLGFQFEYDNENAIGYDAGRNLLTNKGGYSGLTCSKVNLIKKYYSSTDELLDSFDINVCCVAIDIVAPIDVSHEADIFQFFAAREMKLNTLPTTPDEFFLYLGRIYKYINKGFTLEMESLLDLIDCSAKLFPQTSGLVKKAQYRPVPGGIVPIKKVPPPPASPPVTNQSLQNTRPATAIPLYAFGGSGSTSVVLKPASPVPASQPVAPAPTKQVDPSVVMCKKCNMVAQWKNCALVCPGCWDILG